jgi:hypothetical protein
MWSKFMPHGAAQGGREEDGGPGAEIYLISSFWA